MTVDAESGTQVVLGKEVSDLQSNVTVDGTAISGTLNYVTDYTQFSSQTELQSGNYLALKFSDIDPTATSVKVGLVPSAIGMDLVEIIDDPDKNGVFRITNKDTQKLHVVTSDGTNEKTQIFDLSGLTLEAQGEG